MAFLGICEIKKTGIFAKQFFNFFFLMFGPAFVMFRPGTERNIYIIWHYVMQA